MKNLLRSIFLLPAGTFLGLLAGSALGARDVAEVGRTLMLRERLGRPVQLFAQDVKELGEIVLEGMRVTLLVRPPVPREEYAKMMEKMGGMPGMMREGMGRKMPMAEMAPTHYLGVIVQDARTGKVIQNLSVTLLAEGNGRTYSRSLLSMEGSYADNVAFPGKGRYSLTFKISRPAGPGMPPLRPVEAKFRFRSD